MESTTNKVIRTAPDGYVWDDGIAGMTMLENGLEKVIITETISCQDKVYIEVEVPEGSSEHPGLQRSKNIVGLVSVNKD